MHKINNVVDSWYSPLIIAVLLLIYLFIFPYKADTLSNFDSYQIAGILTALFACFSSFYSWRVEHRISKKTPNSCVK